MAAPVTRVENVVETLHGVEVRDPYRWLEDAGSQETQDWTREQNAHTRAVLDSYSIRPAVEARLRECLDAGALGVWVPRGGRRLFTRRDPGMDQPALYVDEGHGARLLADPLAMAGDPTAALDWWYPSQEGDLVAFGVSTGGDEVSTLRLIDVATGELLADTISRCRGASLAFEPGGRAFLYTRYPDPALVAAGDGHYHRHVFRHRVGEDPAADEEVFGAGREKTDFPSQITVSADGNWWLITVAQGWARTSVHLARAGQPFQPIFEGPEAIAEAGFEGDRLLVRTNLGAPNWRLCEAEPESPAPEAWRDLVPESEHVLLGAALAGDRLLVHHLVAATSRLSVHRAGGGPAVAVEVPPFTTVDAIGTDPRSSTAYVRINSFVRPAWIAEVDTATGSAVEVEALAAPPGFDGSAIAVRQVRFPSADGTELTMFLAGRAGGSGPTVLTGYGGFQISQTPQWMPAVIPFLERGGLLAVANLRGGAEYGEGWHRDGMLDRKQHTFDDFIAAARWLIAGGLTTASHLGIKGGSNGGLLVGAAITQAPELFAAAVCRVPLLDMVRYEEFRIAKLWAAEYGSAADPEQFAWLQAYSPYHRVRAGVRYPPTLLTTAEGDSRVDPMHARKMAAQLQAADPEGLVLLRVEERAGHGQGKPVSMTIPEEADCWAFLMANLGCEG